MPYAALIGAGISAEGQLQAGYAKQNAENYNATIANTNAGAIAQETPLAVQQVRMRAEQRIGAATAAYGASGVQGTTGSPEAIIAQSNAQAALDEALVQHNYEMKQYGFEASATLDLFEGEQAKIASEWGAAGAVIGGFGQAASNMKAGGGSSATPSSLDDSSGGGDAGGGDGGGGE